MKLIKTVLLLAVILISADMIYSQANTSYNGVKPEVYTGAKSFVFLYTPFQSNLGSAPAGSAILFDYKEIDISIGSISQLVFYEVPLGGVGFKYFVSDQISLTGGLCFGSKTNDWEDSEKTGTSTKTYQDKLSASVFGISVDADYHIEYLYNISPYIGVNVNYTSATAEGSYTKPDTAPDFEETLDYSSSGVGIGVNIGFDWYFSEGISLGGKYTISYQGFSGPEYEVTTKDGNYSTTDKYEGTSISFFGTGIISLLLNVHF